MGDYIVPLGKSQEKLYTEALWNNTELWQKFPTGE